MKAVTFTVRLPVREREILALQAEVFGVSEAALMREIMHEGLRRRLDPAEIDRRMDTVRARQHAAAQHLRDRIDGLRCAAEDSEETSPSGEIERTEKGPLR
ncbi:hypothetical protein ACWDSJ_28110 [Nocardia sp. NPDC003482]